MKRARSRELSCFRSQQLISYWSEIWNPRSLFPETLFKNGVAINYILHNMILISGAQHGESIFLYVMKWRPVTVRPVTLQSYYCIVDWMLCVYISSSWLIYFIAGSLYLTCFICPPTPLLSVSVTLFLFYYACAFVLFSDSIYKWNHTAFVFLCLT